MLLYSIGRSRNPKRHLFSKNIVDSPLCDCGSIEDTTSCTRIHHTIWKIQNPITNYDQMYFIFNFIMLNYFGISTRLNRVNFSFILQNRKIYLRSPPPPRLSSAPPTLFHYYWIGYLNLHVCFHSFFTCYTYCIVPNYLVNVLP